MSKSGQVPSGDVRLTLNVKAELHQKLKIASAMTRTTMGELVEQLIADSLTEPAQWHQGREVMTLPDQAAEFAAYRQDPRDATDIRRAFMAGALAALTSTTPRDQLLRECIDFGRAIGTPAERAKA